MHEVDLEDLMVRIESEVLVKYAPLTKVGREIVAAAMNVRDEVKPFIPGSETKKLEREAYVFFECMWFWTHIASHQVLNIFPEEHLNESKIFLGKLLPDVAIDSYFQHWDEPMKIKMRSEFLDNMNDAEGEYTESRNGYEVFGFDGLFVDFARRIVGQCDLEDQWEHIRTPLVATIDRQWKRSTFTFSQIDFQDFYRGKACQS